VPNELTNFTRMRLREREFLIPITWILFGEKKNIIETVLKEGITFDDVLLIPRKSRVFSRKNVATNTRLSKNISLSIPLVSANMDTVTEARMARAMAEQGGIGIIHRFLSAKQQIEEVRKVKRAQNIVIEDPVTIEETKTLGDVRKLIAHEGISSVLVTEKNNNKKLRGIITARDLLFEEKQDTPIRKLLVGRLVTAPPSISLTRAKELLRTHKIEKLPLVTKGGILEGLITLQDIIKKSKTSLASKDSKGHLIVGAAVGVKNDALERTTGLLAVGADVIVLDIAHGHNVRAVQMVKKLKRKFGNKIELIAGNIATEEAARDLIRAGADGLKVGIGPGAACTTRIVTGVGVPQLTAIKDVVKVAKKHRIPVIADGGVKNSGNFAKALAAGAHSVMVGNLFAGCKESPGEYIMDRGTAYKYYRGMASHEAESDKVALDGVSDDFSRAPEGASGKIPYRGDVAMVIEDFVGGLRSSMSYLGAHTIEEFHKNARFIRITNAGMDESKPHGV